VDDSVVGFLIKDKANCGRHVNLQALEYKTGLPAEGLILTFPLLKKILKELS